MLERTSPRGPGSRGTVIVEFALLVTFLLVLTLCVIDVSRAFWTKNVTTQAAREGARYLVVHTLADTAGVRSRVETVVDASGATLTQCTVTDLGNRQWQVSVGCDFTWLIPGLFNWLGVTLTNPQTLTATTVMRQEG